MNLPSRMAISSTPRLTILTRLGVVAALVLASCGSDREPLSRPDDQRLLDDADAGRTDAAPVAPSCSSSMTPIERVPVVIQFLVDTSLSMQYGGIWPATRQASLASFADLQATADASTFIGLSFFPSTYTIRPGSFLDKAHYDSMVEIIDVSGVGGGTDEYGTTPTYWGLTRAYNVIEAFEPPSNQGLKVSETKRVVVLLSDGAPTDDSTNRIVPLVKAKYESTPSIRTFSVAILPLAQGQGVDFMGRVAVAGGTAPAGCEEDSLDVAKVCHFHIVPNGVSDDIRKALIAALDEIRALSASCEFYFTRNDYTDLGDVKVTVTDREGVATPIPKDAENGWSFDDDESPTKVVLRGTSCSAVTGVPSGRVDVELGCRVPR